MKYLIKLSRGEEKIRRKDENTFFDVDERNTKMSASNKTRTQCLIRCDDYGVMIFLLQSNT